MIIFVRLKIWTALIMDDVVKSVRIRTVQIRTDKVHNITFNYGPSHNPDLRLGLDLGLMGITIKG